MADEASPAKKQERKHATASSAVQPTIRVSIYDLGGETLVRDTRVTPDEHIGRLALKVANAWHLGIMEIKLTVKNIVVWPPDFHREHQWVNWPLECNWDETLENDKQVREPVTLQIQAVKNPHPPDAKGRCDTCDEHNVDIYYRYVWDPNLAQSIPVIGFCRECGGIHEDPDELGPNENPEEQGMQAGAIMLMTGTWTRKRRRLHPAALTMAGS